MIDENDTQTRKFKALLKQVRQEVEALKSDVAELEEQKTSLRQQLREAEEREADVFSSLSDTERITLKHQVEGLISKINNHLGES